MEVKRIQNSPQFAGKIGNIDIKSIRKILGEKGLDFMKEVLPELKAYHNDSVEFSAKAHRSWLWATPVLKIIAKMDLGYLPFDKQGTKHFVETSFKLSPDSIIRKRLTITNLTEELSNMFNKKSPSKKIKKFTEQEETQEKQIRMDNQELSIKRQIAELKRD